MNVDPDVVSLLNDHFATLATEEWVDSVEWVPEENLWLVRLIGEDRDITAVWFILQERHLYHETAFLPAPDDDPGTPFWRFLLRANATQVGAHFCIGKDGGIYLVGAIPVEDVSAERVDLTIGIVYATVERYFRAGLRAVFPGSA